MEWSNMNKYSVVIVTLSLCALATVSKSSAETTMEETHWQLAQYVDEAGELIAALSETTVDIRFSDGNLSGSGGCNRYFGTYTLGEANEIGFPSQMVSTQMACVPPVAEQEQRYLALLTQVAVWEIEDEQLVLSDQEGRALLKYIGVEPPSLEGTDWQATGINNGKGGVVSTGTTNLSAATFTDGTVSGSGGCNRFNAAYEINGNRITIAPAAATRKFCSEPEGLMDQEQQFFAALERSFTYTLTHGKLELRDEGGSLQVSFRVAEP